MEAERCDGEIRNNIKATIDSQMEGQRVFADFFNEISWIRNFYRDPGGPVGWEFTLKILHSKPAPIFRHYLERYADHYTKAEREYLISKSDPEVVKAIDEVVDLLNCKMLGVVENRDREGVAEISEAIECLYRLR